MVKVISGLSVACGVVSLFIVCIAVFLLFNTFGNCSQRAYNTYDVGNSDWILETHGPSCYLGGTFATELIARNTISNETIKIATGDLSGISSIKTSSNEVIISLRNRSFVSPANSNFGPTKVVYDYQ
ncbi:MAG: hypothetical protein ACRYG8_34930 [Janthinobacterium lividum]